MTRTHEAQAEWTTALDTLFAEFGRSDSPGLVVGISDERRFFGYRHGFGLASVQHGVANSPRTRVRIASITKQFTCVALMLLAEDGRLVIDDPVSRYLTDLPDPLGSATLRQLMTHTSGWRCTLEIGTIANGFAVQPPGWQDRALRRQADLQFSPGEGQIYCNGSYVALGAVIEHCAGETYAAFLKRRIFEPLAMYDTEVVANDLAMVAGLASAHVRLGDSWARPPVDTDLGADGGIVSSIDDMLRWLAHLRGPKRIGTDESWRQLLAPALLENGFETTYAMGFKRHSYRGLDVIQHSGGLFGLNAHALTVPSHGLDIVIVVNGAPASAARLAFTAVDLLLADFVKAPAPLRPATADYYFLLGHQYALPNGVLLGFADLAGLLGLSQMNMAPAPILYESENALFALFEEIGFGPLAWSKSDLARFRDDPQAGLLVTIAGQTHWLECVPSARGLELDLLVSSAGTYASEELQARAVIAVAGEAAVLRLKGDYSAERQFALSAFTVRHLGMVSADGGERYALELDSAVDGPARGFWIDTHRARRIRFEREPSELP